MWDLLKYLFMFIVGILLSFSFFICLKCNCLFLLFFFCFLFLILNVNWFFFCVIIIFWGRLVWIMFFLGIVKKGFCCLLMEFIFFVNIEGFLDIFFFLNFKFVLFGWMEILIGGRFLIVRFLFFFIMLLYCWRSWMVLFCVIMLILRLGFWCLLFWILFGGFFKKLVNWMVRFGDFDIGIVGM